MISQAGGVIMIGDMSGISLHCLLRQATKHAIIATMKHPFASIGIHRTTVERYLLAAG
jgi:hypothetical protein